MNWKKGAIQSHPPFQEMVHQNFLLVLGNINDKCMASIQKSFAFIIPKPKDTPLIKFQMEVAHELLQCTDSTSFEKKRGRPLNAQRHSLIISLGSPSSSVTLNQYRKFQPDPTNSLRYDKVEHWVVFAEKRRCRLCKTGTPMSKCIKCKVHLCCNNNKNCFISYHA